MYRSTSWPTPKTQEWNSVSCVLLYEACPRWTYGGGCSHDCDCVQENSLRCDAQNGMCTCKPGYHGDRCQAGELGYVVGQNPEIIFLKMLMWKQQMQEVGTGHFIVFYSPDTAAMKSPTKQDGSEIAVLWCPLVAANISAAPRGSGSASNFPEIINALDIFITLYCVLNLTDRSDSGVCVCVKGFPSHHIVESCFRSTERQSNFRRNKTRPV